MIIGICKMSVAIPGNRSLKGKRKVVKSIKDRVRSKYNAAVAEVDNHDVHQSATLGITVVSSDGSHADSQLQTIINFISTQADVTHVATELTSR